MLTTELNLHRRDVSGKPVRPWISNDGNEASKIHAWPIDIEPPRQTDECKRQALAEFAERNLREDVRRAIETERRKITKEMRDIVKKKKVAALDKLDQQIKDKKREARASLAKELKSARKKRRSLYDEIESLEEAVRKKTFETEKMARRQYAQRILSARSWLRKLISKQTDLSLEFAREYKDITDSRFAHQLYPDPPPPMFPASIEGDCLPEAAGIYFLWCDDKIEYVGKSSNLFNRVKLRTHHRLKKHHMISFLVFEPYEISWAECYYIGTLRPQINFGQNAAHNKFGGKS